MIISMHFIHSLWWSQIVKFLLSRACSSSKILHILHGYPLLPLRILFLQLPLRIDIIKHAREMDGKSTAVHAAVLAPQDVRIFTYPCIPNYNPEENVSFYLFEIFLLAGIGKINTLSYENSLFWAVQSTTKEIVTVNLCFTWK